MKIDPKPEHAWFKQLVGEWTTEAPITLEDGKTVISTGSETVTMLGELWTVCEGRHEMAGDIGQSRMTLGFDPTHGGYCGTWVGSMMDKMWVYKGTMNEAGTELVLAAEGPDFQEPGKTTMYHDIITIIDADTRTLTARYKMQDGTWSEMMRVTYTRKSK